MIAALLDTAVVVDLLRGFPPAISWLGAERVAFGVSPIVWLEILDGAKSSAAQRDAVRLLRSFTRIDYTAEDTSWAIDRTLSFRLSHGIDPFDCLIAAPCKRLGLPLFTRNLKHFSPLIGSLAQAPYSR